MFGLGLYIYSGEDLPENIEEDKKTEKSKETKVKKEEVIMIQDTQKEIIKSDFTEDEIKGYLKEVKKSKLSELTLVEASNLIKRKNGGK